MAFEEFCAAALSVYQLDALYHCEQHARCVYEIFERDGNRAIVIEELASPHRWELGFVAWLVQPDVCESTVKI
ncbi:hypothetical protein CerSpe_017320 [Prunus speciosa]